MVKNFVHNILIVFFFIIPVQGMLSFDSNVTYSVKYIIIIFLWLIALYSFFKESFCMNYVFTILLSLTAIFTFLSQVSLFVNGASFTGHIKSLLTSLVISIAPLIIILSNYFKDKNNIIQSCLMAIVVGTVFVVLVSTVYYFTSWDVLVPQAFLNRSARLYGVIKSPNALALMSAVSIGCSLVLFYRYYINYKLFASANLVLLYGLLCSLSKSIIVAAIISAIVWIYSGKLWSLQWRKGTVLLFSSLVLVSIALASASTIWKQQKKVVVASHYLNGQEIMKKMPKWKRFNPENKLLGVLRIKPDVMKTGNRIGVWKAGLAIFSENWLVGIGLDNWKGKLAEENYKNYDSPHNGFIEISGGLGIFGATLYIAFPVILILFAIKYISIDIYRILFVSLVIFFLFRELITVSGIITFSVNGMAFWSIIGLLFSSFPEKMRESSRNCIDVKC